MRDLAAARPQVVLVSGEPGPVATALLAELARQLPRRPRGGLAGAGRHGGGGQRGHGGDRPCCPRPPSPRSGRRVLRRLGGAGRPEALYGYDAMDAVLDAVREGGGDRRAVTRAALAPLDRRGVTGRMRQVRSGDVVRGRVALVPLDGGTPRIRPLGP